MNIEYRIANDGGEYMPSRPWHVEANIGYGWDRCAVCQSEEEAREYIAWVFAHAGYEPEDALGLGYYK